MNSPDLPIRRLEQYSSRYPQEVLHLRVQKEDSEDEILVFKGFSSSLIQSTDFDPDIPLLQAEESILQIDRLVSPYQGENSQYLERNLSWEEMAIRLQGLGL